jgi:hypothetical protein
MNARKAKIGHGLSLNMPLILSKNTGVINVIIAAKTQCVLAPKDWPLALILFGKISAIKTHITAPCPIACEAINNSKNESKNCGLPDALKAYATRERLMIYPIEPIINKVFLPNLSIRYKPTKVKTRFVPPI